MYRRILSVSLCLLLLLYPGSVFAAGRVRFAPLPMESPEAIEQQFLPFSNYLGQQLGSEVELLHFQNYQTLINSLLADKVDLAYLGPLPFVLLQQENSSFVPLVRFLNAAGVSSYTCSLVSFEASLDLSKVNSQTPIALTQPYSTCGFLLTAHQLQLLGKDLTALPHYYAGNHSTAALDVIRGKAAFAGVKTSVARHYRHLGLHVFEYETALPGHLLVANSRTLNEAQIQAVRDALLALDPKGSRQDYELTAEWGEEFRHGAIAVTPGDYAYISDLLSQIKIPGVNE